jgi:hypothetical protein
VGKIRKENFSFYMQLYSKAAKLDGNATKAVKEIAKGAVKVQPAAARAPAKTPAKKTMTKAPVEAKGKIQFPHCILHTLETG